MDKRYQMFVSSTFADLVQERQAVMQALLSLDHFPAGMELFPASDEDQWTLIKGVIDDSDYYVIVIAGRYGSQSPDGISYTEKEFDYAVESGIPILAFLHEDPDELPAKNTDQNDEARKKLDALRQKVCTGRHVKFWRSADDLKAKVIQAVAAETKRNPKVGWVRANLSSDPARLNALLVEIEDLKAALSQARTQPPQGAEQYAQRGDEFEITYRYREKYLGPWSYAGYKLSWSMIFYEIGPLIMDEASEHVIKRRFSAELNRYVLEEVPVDLASFEILDGTFEAIKVQLLALGLMKKSTKKHAASDTNTYWSITPYGEQELVRLRAIRRVTERKKAAS
jgi:hypothetical protein